MDKLTQHQAKLKPLDVQIRSINTVPLMMQNAMTNQAAPTFMVFGLGEDNLIYLYDNDKKEWREM